MNIERISSTGLFSYGLSYLIAGNMLHDKSKDVVLYPKLFMYAHAIELGLKAYIFEKTTTIKETHNLNILLNDAKLLGLEVTDTFISICNTFSFLNKDDHRMRYFKSGYTFTPNNQISFDETNNFYDFLKKEIPYAETMTRRAKIA